MTRTEIRTRARAIAFIKQGYGIRQVMQRTGLTRLKVLAAVRLIEERKKKRTAYQMQWAKKNKDKVNETRRKYEVTHRKKPLVKLKRNERRRLRLRLNREKANKERAEYMERLRADPVRHARWVEKRRDYEVRNEGRIRLVKQARYAKNWDTAKRDNLRRITRLPEQYSLTHIPGFRSLTDTDDYIPDVSTLAPDELLMMAEEGLL